MESGMQFMTTLFGGSTNTLLNSAFALGIVLVMIVLGVWVLKVFTRAGANVARGRNRRLTVVDSAMVDGKRQVIIIRRDNVEHLIMTGGPQDLVIESGIAAPPLAPYRAGRPTAAAPAPKSAAPATRPDVATPSAPEHAVSRDTIDRLHDLARPAPLTPRAALRHTALLHPVSAPDPVIPMGPELRVDNSNGAQSDSATPGAVETTSGHTRLGRNRFFRGISGDRR
jgi:flagellar protein FliO/FliZ